jgi:hypothetical protein
MTCTLCGQPIDGTTPAVPTSEGQHVHIRCADRAARVANRARAIQAGITALGLAGLLLLTMFHWSGVILMLLFALSLALHVALNHHWWRRRVQPMRVWAWRTRRVAWWLWCQPRR